MLSVDTLAEDALDDGVGFVVDVCDLVETDLLGFGGDRVFAGAVRVLAEYAPNEHGDRDARSVDQLCDFEVESVSSS